jgi:hypothetical protein
MRRSTRPPTTHVLLVPCISAGLDRRDCYLHASRGLHTPGFGASSTRPWGIDFRAARESELPGRATSDHGYRVVAEAIAGLQRRMPAAVDTASVRPTTMRYVTSLLLSAPNSGSVAAREAPEPAPPVTEAQRQADRAQSPLPAHSPARTNGPSRPSDRGGRRPPWSKTADHTCHSRAYCWTLPRSWL